MKHRLEDTDLAGVYLNTALALHVRLQPVESIRRHDGTRMPTVVLDPALRVFARISQLPDGCGRRIEYI